MNKHANTVIDRIGGTAAAARLFKVRMPSVSSWRIHGIPRARMMFLEVARPEAVEGVDVAAATSLADPDAGIVGFVARQQAASNDSHVLAAQKPI